MNKVRKTNPFDFFKLNNETDRIQFLLRFATLAPSTHNTQPWKFSIEKDRVHVYYDPALKLPIADPTGRYMLISVGAMIEQLIIAASYFMVLGGYKIKVDNTTHKVAEIVFNNIMSDSGVVNHALDGLMEAMTARANVREGFEATPPSIDFEKSLIKNTCCESIELNILTHPKHIEAIANYTANGTLLTNRNKAFRREISKWIVPNTSGRKDGLHGTTLGFNTMASLAAPTAIKYIDMGKKMAEKSKQHILSSSMICVFSAVKNDERSWVEVGRKAVRCMLQLQENGFGHSVFTAALEYGNHIPQIQKITNPRLIPQFIFAAGKVKNNARIFSKRHDVNDKVMHTPPLSQRNRGEKQPITTSLLNLNIK